MSNLLGSLSRKGKDLLKKKMGNQTHSPPASAAASPASSAQFNIVCNPTFTEGTNGWFGQGCSLSLGQHAASTFCIAHDRKQTWEGIAQDIGERLEINVDYRVEAWIGIGGAAEEAQVQGTVKLEKASGDVDYVWLGSVGVTKGKWCLFNGKLRISELPSKATLYFEGPAPGVDILISSVAVIPLIVQEEQKGNNLPAAMDDLAIGPVGGSHGGGSRVLVTNSGFAEGLRDWRAKNCNIYVSENLDGGKILPATGKCFAVAGNRTEAWQGIEQEITGRIEESLRYSVSGLVRIRGGNVAEANMLATLYMQFQDGKEHYITVAKAQLSNTQWTELKGDFQTNNLPKLATVYLEGPPGGVDLLVDNFAIFVPIRAKPAGPPVFQDPKHLVNIISDSNLENGLGAWYPQGGCRLSVASGSPLTLGANAARSFVRSPPPSLHGRFIIATNRNYGWEGPAQTITDKIQLFNTYQVTAWVAVALPHGSRGVLTPQNVNVALGVDGQWVTGGEVFAGANWTEVSGGFRLEKKPENVHVYFQGPGKGVDLLVAGLQIFAVDRLARVPHLREQTDKVRKRDVVLRLQDSSGYSVPPGTRVTVKQTKNSFPLGACISQWNLDNKGYVKFFVEQFNWAVFDNEIKWYWTEEKEGELKYADADEMVALCNRHGISMRGHCICWEAEGAVQPWLKQLDARELMEAVQNRVSNLLTRYKGQFKHYDVNNEMLHASFFRDRLGQQFLPYLFQLAHQFDPQALLFVNDYHVEDGKDVNSSPQKYIEQIRWLQANGAPVGGIGIQGHLTSPIGPIIAQALDELSTLGLPIWFTEVDVESVNEHLRADDLEVVLREAYAHPGVEGFVLWGFWEGSMSTKNAQLVDSDKRINECGRRFIALKQEWLTSFEGVTNQQGEVAFRGFQGDYDLIVQGRQATGTFTVSKGQGPSTVVLRV